MNMRRPITICALVVLAGVLAGCGGTGDTTTFGNSPYGADMLTLNEKQQLVSDATTALTTGAAPQVTTGIDQFGFELLRKQSKAQPDTNICISPVSVEQVIAMLYNGAAGATQKQIAGALAVPRLNSDQITDANKHLIDVLSNVDPEKVQLNISNSLWVDSNIALSPQFAQKNSDAYRAKITTLDFQSPTAPTTINSWVNDSTKGKIPQIIDKVPSDARMYVINAVYFKGSWQRPFNKDRTEPATFTLANGKTVQTPMMNQQGSFKYFSNAALSGLSMPYGSGRLEMVVLLPSSADGLPKLEKELDNTHWQKWTKALQESEVQVSLPTFTADYDATLNDSLKAIGLTDAFDPVKANFQSMLAPNSASSEKLYLSEVKHKTYIDVNEQGTEAAAATSGQMTATAILRANTFNADHPFLYVVRDTQTGAIVFTGVLLNPVPPETKSDKK